MKANKEHMFILQIPLKEDVFYPTVDGFTEVKDAIYYKPLVASDTLKGLQVYFDIWHESAPDNFAPNNMCEVTVVPFVTIDEENNE